MLYGTYAGKKVTMQIGSIVCQGYAKGTFCKATRNEDAFSLEVGGDGNAARTQNANRSGRMEFTLMSTSPSNDELQAQAILDEQAGGGVAEAFIKDTSGTALAHGANAWIVKIPDLERAKEQGEVTWIVETDLLELQQGGVLPIPGT
jgi:hypothetical protein